MSDLRLSAIATTTTALLFTTLVLTSGCPERRDRVTPEYIVRYYYIPN